MQRCFNAYAYIIYTNYLYNTLYTYKYMHSYWKPLQPLCSWYGYWHGTADPTVQCHIQEDLNAQLTNKHLASD